VKPNPVRPWRSNFQILTTISLMAVASPSFAPLLQGQTLRDASAKFPGLRVGAAIKSSSLSTAPYANTVRYEFNMPSTENDTKWNPLRPTQNQFAFAGADLNVSFARAAGEQIRGHTMQWYKSIPTWLTGGGFTTTEARNILYDHIDTVGAHFQGGVFAWDAANEAFNGDGSLRDSFWYNMPGIGYETEGTRYLEETFIRTAAAAPDALIIYNDFGAEEMNSKSNAIYAMAQDFVSRGVPLDGIGFQMHIEGINYTSLRNNFKRFNDLGMDLHITELDVRVPVDGNGNATPAALETQAQTYFDLLGVALGQPRFTVLQTWGVADNDSWIPGFFPGYGEALLFDDNYQRKPAYWGVWNALANQAEKFTVLDVSAGDSTAVFTQEALNAGKGLQLAADAPGDFMTLELPVPFPGQWNVKIGYRVSGASGQFQLATAEESSATFADFGSAVDLYSGPTGTAVTDLGDLTVPAAGNWQFRFTVAGQNAAASDHNLTIDYIRITPVADPSNTFPTISNVTDKTTNQDTASGSHNFTIGDAETAAGALDVTAISLNTTLLPTENITVGGSGTNRTVTLNPAAGEFGSAAVLLLVSDGVNTTPETFILNVSEGTSDRLWTRITPGTESWNNPPNWLANKTPVSSTKLSLRFLDGLTLRSGTVTATNDLAGTTSMNSLTLGGTGVEGSASGVTLSGAPLNISGTLPIVNLTANKDPASASSLAYSVTNSITLSSNTTFTGNGSAAFEFSEIIDGGANITKSGVATLKLTAPNTYSGTTSLAGGILDVGTISNGSLGTAGLLFSNSAVLQGNGVFTRTFSNSATASTNQITGTSGGFAAKGGTLTLNFGGLAIPASISLNNGGYRFGTNFVLGSAEADSPLIVVNPVGLGGFNRTITVIPGTGVDFARISGMVSDVWGIIKDGDGLLALSGDNTNTGVTTINAGTLRAESNNAFGIGVASVSINGTGATLELANGISINRPLTINDTGDNKTIRLQNEALTGTYTGTVAIQETSASNFDIEAGPGQTLTVSGKISGTGAAGIDKLGNGTVVLSAPDNSYTSPTRIKGGVLLVTNLSDAGIPGSIGSTSDISGNLVINGGTLRHEANNTTSTNRKFATGLNGATIDSSATSPAHTMSFTSLFAMGFNGELGARTVTLTGSNTGANIISIDIDDDPSANPTSLIKNGAGTWWLTGQNNYTGDTTANSGTLELGDGGRLKFRIGATSGTNNRITGAGNVNLDGAFLIDTADAITAGLTSGSWTLEDVPSLTGPYGATFSVNGFSDAGSNLWTMEDATRKWTFNETTGTLTLSPVGGTPYEAWIDSPEFNAPPLSAAEKLETADVDFDGCPNYLEFALHGNPVDASNQGLTAPLIQDSSAPAGDELTLVAAIRNGALFRSQPDGTLAATVDGMTYTIEGSLDVIFPSEAVSSTGPAAIAPAATGLPDLTGSDWEYHIFKLNTSEGLPGRGFLRIKVAQP
jgi:endo-1,4-beta-xylanase